MAANRRIRYFVEADQPQVFVTAPISLISQISPVASESAAAALDALGAEYPDKTIEVIQSDANAALKTLCGQYQWRSERAVLFLDPFGMHVEWSTLEAIAKTGAVSKAPWIGQTGQTMVPRTTVVCG